MEFEIPTVSQQLTKPERIMKIGIIRFQYLLPVMMRSPDKQQGGYATISVNVLPESQLSRLGRRQESSLE